METGKVTECGHSFCMGKHSILKVLDCFNEWIHVRGKCKCPSYGCGLSLHFKNLNNYTWTSNVQARIIAVLPSPKQKELHESILIFELKNTQDSYKTFQSKLKVIAGRFDLNHNEKELAAKASSHLNRNLNREVKKLLALEKFVIILTF